jgi:hypothetical protein
MRIEEIQVGSPAERRVSRLKADAKAAKERARQMKVRADTSAAQLDMKKARQKLLRQRCSGTTTTIKPYH